MAKLLAVLDESSFNQLEDETIKGLYKQNNDTKAYYLNLDESEAEKLTFNLNEKLENKKIGFDKVHNENRELKTALQAYEQFGKPEEIKEKIESGEPEAVTELVAKHRAEIDSIKKSYDEELGKYKTSYETEDQRSSNMMKETAIAGLVMEFGLDKELAPAVLEKHIDIQKAEDGKKQVVVMQNGEPFRIAGNQAKPTDLIQHFIEEGKYKNMFPANNGGGTGGSNNQTYTNAGAKVMTRKEFDEQAQKNPVAVRNFLKEGGEIKND